MIIPEKLKVGFQKRDDTYLGKLAFITYYNLDGSLRGEKSFESWVSDSIPREDFENKPQKGYVLNKGVKRCSSFGGNNHKIRIFDPRGFEFEITVDNLLELTQYSNINFQEIEQECVFGWNGNQVYLVPTNIAEYQKHIENKKNQNDVKVFDKKDNLVVGYTYATKSMPYLYYVGKVNKEDYFLTDKNNFTKVRKASIIAQVSTTKKINHESLVEMGMYLVDLFNGRKVVYNLKDSVKDEIFEKIFEGFNKLLNDYKIYSPNTNCERLVELSFCRAITNGSLSLIFDGKNGYEYQESHPEYKLLFKQYELDPKGVIEKIKSLLKRDMKMNIYELKNDYSIKNTYIKMENIVIDYDSLEELLENSPIFISKDCFI